MLKKTIFSTWVILLSCLLYTQPSLAEDDDDDDGGQVFIVFPSTVTDPLTKAQEDWFEINEALQSAGPGDTVKLAAGLFYLHKTVVRRDFHGTLKGAGKNETTVQLLDLAIKQQRATDAYNTKFGKNKKGK